MGEDKKLDVCEAQHKHHEKLIWVIFGVLASAIVYAMDWQREQDAHMAKIDEISARQTAILEKQIEWQEVFVPYMSYGYSSGRNDFYRDEPVIPAAAPSRDSE